jgi:NAD(P) transhydrogenase subunit beta
VAYRKLSGKQKDKRTLSILYISRILLKSYFLLPVFHIFGFLPISIVALTLILSVLGLIYGVLFVLPIGGADMPVVISLLNSLTGVATALAGILYGNNIMIAGGIFVGAAGILLTLLMCNAMNRSIFAVIGGKFNGSGVASGDEEELDIKATTLGETATKLAFAQKVAIIPGYGLAVAQAQHLCSQLQGILEEKDTEVHYIIHPVAGRMPGHMNVLLAEADVHYDKLKEMDEVNDAMNEYDVALVIGANDVVNPAAEQDENSPIYGMPIIKAYNAREVVVIKRGMNKGYAGVENRLFGYDNCQLLFSDAKVALSGLINELKVL